MRLIFTSYVSVPAFNDPDEWLRRIEGYTGILESLSRHHSVIGIERINFEGVVHRKGVTFHFIRLKKMVARFPRSMHRLIRQLDPDVVFINGFIFPVQIIQLRLSIGRKKKIIVLHRAERPYKGWKKYLQVAADQCVNAYLFTARDFGDEWMRQGIIHDRENIHEIIQGSSRFCVRDKRAARCALSIEGEPIYLWVGRLDKNKDPSTVISAFIRFLKFQPEARLYMIFQTAELLDEMRRMIEKHPDAGKAIRLIGMVAHHELELWYNGADYIISGSHYEGSGIAVCEAMSCGCIPILTNIPSFRKMTGPGRCGMIYEPGNVDDLLLAMQRTISMNIEEEREKVLLQFRDEVSFEAIARKITRVMSSINNTV